jgi:L-2,4-diaminobutyric acid acetyltransferase
LQCTHFADSCIIAEYDGAIAGWVSGYRPPSEPDSFFVWQVAVAPAARGQRLGGRMIEALLDRPSADGVTHLITTVTEDNGPSWALFEGLARWGPEATDTQYLRVYIGLLRQKIEEDPSDPCLLLTEPGVGYRLLGTN